MLDGNVRLQQTILQSTLSQLPIIGGPLREPRGLQGSGLAIVLGGVVALYGALGVAQALQNAMNVAWVVPRHRRPNPLKARARSLLLVATAGSAVLVTTVLSAIGSSAGSFGADVSWLVAILAIGASTVTNVALFVIAFRVSTAHKLGTRDALPGAIVGAAVWQTLQLSGTAYVAHFVKGAANSYGVFALVLGLLGWLFLAAEGIVFGAEVNVVRLRRLYPRALLTPFTDNINLTDGDRRTYAAAAAAQRFKGFENVLVTFENDGQNASVDGG